MPRIIHICQVCLRVQEEPAVCHGRQMARIDCGEPGSELCRPVMDARGRLKGHAPRWWVDHVLAGERGT